MLATIDIEKLLAVERDGAQDQVSDTRVAGVLPAAGRRHS